MKFSLAGVLSSLPLAIDDEGPSSLMQAKRTKIVIKTKGKVCDKNTLMEDVHIDFPRDTDPMQIDGDQTIEDSPVLDLFFSSAHAKRDVEVMRSCIFSHMSEVLSNRRIEHNKKVLTIYNRKILTIQDYLVRASQRLVTNLKVVKDEKSKKVNHLENKISSLKKSCEASEARVKEQEKKIDNLRSTLACTHHNAVETYKASS
ncbi:Uncharacterized protein Adt_23702 [Abeliophyllum distichum]|uniref:Uncharacterized protein n=1 Tax=Abeliophyllum distichum TaxID=126358 RepID=A0ABD1SBL2_9LAMI